MTSPQLTLGEPCFAGGGAIPLEALRLGCDTTALDLNPVAHLIEKGVLEFPQRFGADASGGPLAEAFVRWAGWVKARAEAELASLFPCEDGKIRPSVFFWCRTMTCPNPGCGTEVPLLSSLRLADSTRRQVWLRLDLATDPVGIELVEGAPPESVDVNEATVRAGSMTCPRCATAMSGPNVREHAKRVPFGTRLYAVLDVRGRHRAYRPPSDDELRAARSAAVFLERFGELDDGMSELPDEPVDSIGYNNLQNLPYGYTTWRSLFTDRQLAVLGTLCRTTRAAHAAMLEEGIDLEFAAAVTTYYGAWQLLRHVAVHLGVSA